MSEFGEGVGALRRAAGHFAQGTAERLSPTYDRARNVAGRGWETTRDRMSPAYERMREGAGRARSMKHQKEAPKRSRMRTMRGLLIAGAAVGAASAAVARRRRQQAEWQNYDAMTGFDESRYAESRYGGKPSAGQKVTSSAATMADSLSSGVGRIADSLHERSAQMQEKAQEAGGAHAGMPMPEPMGPPRGTAPGPVATPGMTGVGPGTPTATPSAPRDRLGDPAIDFPDER